MLLIPTMRQVATLSGLLPIRAARLPVPTEQS